MNLFSSYWRWSLRRGSWWGKALAIGGPVLALLIVVGALAGGSSNTTEEPNSPAKTNSAEDPPKPPAAAKEEPTATPVPAKPTATLPPALPAIGQPVTLEKDGWILTVTGVRKVATTKGLLETKTALGVYVVVNLTMENISNKTQSLGGDRFTIIDDRARKYGWYLEGTIGYGQQELGSRINAGLKAPATILFDVPPDATGLVLTSLGGFQVSLGNVADIR